MNRTILILIPFLLLSAVSTTAKQDKNATSKSILTITSYDKEGKTIRTGCAFYISQEGYALSTYDILKNAYSAEVTDSKGRKNKVTRICGANSLYNIVKFRTDNVSASPFPLAKEKVAKGTSVIVLSNDIKSLPPIETSVSDISDIDSLKYYTLEEKINNKYSGCPVLNKNGDVVAIMQTNQNRDNLNSYALDIDFEKLLDPTGMSANEIALNSIHIAKQLPADEPQARTFIFLFAQNTKDTTAYLTALEDYIQAYPEESIGYTQRISYWIGARNYVKAEEDFEKGLAIAKDKENLHYEMSKLIYRINMFKDYQKYKDWDISKAASEAEEAYQINPLPIFTLQKADCQFALKQYKEAFDSYQEVNKSNLASPQTFAAASVSAEMSKQDSTIILAMLDSAINRYGTPHPKAATIYLIQRATHLDRYSRYKEAARDYQEVENLSGTNNLNDNFFYLKSQCDTRAKLYARALSDIEKALRLRPNDYDYLVENALAQWRMGNYDEAIYAGQQALKVNADGADAYKAIGLALGEQGKKAEAIKNLTKAKQLGDPQAEGLIQSLNNR